MIYKTCIDESSISRNVSNGIGMVIFSPFIVLDTLMHQKIDIATISNPYSKIKLIDFSKNESLEVLNDNIKGCDFNFKYLPNSV